MDTLATAGNVALGIVLLVVLYLQIGNVFSLLALLWQMWPRPYAMLATLVTPYSVLLHVMTDAAKTEVWAFERIRELEAQLESRPEEGVR